MKKVLVINSGSSSIKYKLFDMSNKALLAKGLLEKIGEPESRLTHQSCGEQGFGPCVKGGDRGLCTLSTDDAGQDAQAQEQRADLGNVPVQLHGSIHHQDEGEQEEEEYAFSPTVQVLFLDLSSMGRIGPVEWSYPPFIQ